MNIKRLLSLICLLHTGGVFCGYFGNLESVQVVFKTIKDELPMLNNYPKMRDFVYNIIMLKSPQDCLKEYGYIKFINSKDILNAQVIVNMFSRKNVIHGITMLQSLAEKYIPIMVLNNETLYRIIQKTNLDDFQKIYSHDMFNSLWNSDRFEDLKKAIFFGILKIHVPKKKLSYSGEFVTQSIHTDKGLAKIRDFLLYTANQIKNQREKQQLQSIENHYQTIAPQDSGELSILKETLGAIVAREENREFFNQITQEIKHIITSPQEISIKKIGGQKTTPQGSSELIQEIEQTQQNGGSITTHQKTGLSKGQKGFLQAALGISIVGLILLIWHKKTTGSFLPSLHFSTSKKPFK